jgi:hexosaminidase
VDRTGLRIGGDPDGVFYAFETLAQLATHTPRGWVVPCVAIKDAPALRWRVLSDDISRGPLPNMRYFKERIRTIAMFKMNGYAPYAEHVVFDPAHPLPAPLDGLTPAELRDLAAYAKHYHVALIPQQQSFAHMHNSLKWEQYAPLAETAHGYLLAPSNAAGIAYAQDLVRNQLAAVPHPPFFHIGADEPIDLGRGQSKPLVDAQGEGPVYTRFVSAMANFVAGLGTRPLIWDDALARHPELFAQLPRSLVFVNWHYGDERTFVPEIKRIADGGFEQMVAPGSRNWNEIYPDLNGAFANIGRFTRDGKAARVLGLFQTVWHDDGETLFEATWAPVIYAAASAWEQNDVSPASFYAAFPAAFFGVDDPGYARDLEALAAARSELRAPSVNEGGDYLFWADPFDPLWYSRVGAALNASAIRTQAEIVIAHLRVAAPPPLHANAAAVMHVAARRYDLFGRNLQIAREARDQYAAAYASVQAKSDALVERNLFLTKYLFWEQRDAFLELAPLVEAAWTYENRPSHELSVLERYHVAAGRAIQRADAVSRCVYDFYEPRKTLPAWEQLIGPTLLVPQ